MKNLFITKQKGQTSGISNIIIENMNKLSLYERPLHCTDKKRETLYVKNEEWEKDENKNYINKALKSVESKQLKNLNIWLEEHPNYMNNSKEQEEFAELMSECGKSVDEGREKIIKKLCNNVYIEKQDENKEFINKALKSVESKQLKNLNVWLETHPNYMNNPSEQEEFAKLMSECGKSVDEGKDKIIKKVCDNVYIEKSDD